ncbi:Aste57867_23288 [Aphanomyces stellatus]|uniref:Aste57867_23288 protein n=1 Tax=Aphanomyces stellatus TaxID=120398 RepID=A0A485LMA9_9STRA|nr:hypothetical protein As57867_023217 [Aphanomyces stellatus]VFT99933.1 Aste57867_23288 [Aphanomyces stellatus]
MLHEKKRRISEQQQPGLQYKVHPGGIGAVPDDDDDDIDNNRTGDDDNDNPVNDFISTNKEFVMEETTIAAQSISKWWRVRRLQNRIKSKWTPDHLRKMRERQRQIRIQRRIRDIAIYVVFLLVLNMDVLSPFDNASLYYFSANIKHLFMKTPFYADSTNTTTITFHEIKTTTHIHRWLQGPFLTALFSERSDASSGSGDYSLLHYGQVVGAIAVGQLRVTPQVCTSKFPQGVGDQSVFWCYGTTSGLFDTSVESTTPFGSGNGSNFFWNSANADANVSDTRLKFFSSFDGPSTATYPAPAYRLVLPHNDSAATAATLASMHAFNYIDIQTRALFVDLNVANVMLGSLLVLRFAFEFPPSGGVLPTTESFVVPYVATAFNVQTQLPSVVVGVFFAVYLGLLLHACRKEGWPVFRRLDTWVQLASSLAYIIMWLLRVTARLDFPTTHIASTSIQSFRSFAAMFMLSLRFAGAVCFFSYLRLILFLDILPHVNLIVKTIFHSLVQVTGFVFVFGLVVYAYATCYCVVFGASVEMFSTVPRSYTSLLQSLVGDIQYDQMREASPVMAALLFVAFTLVAVFILMQMIVGTSFSSHTQCTDSRLGAAMIIDAYWLTKESTNWERVNLVAETLSYIWLLGMQFIQAVAHVCGVAYLLEEKLADEAKAKLPTVRQRRMDIRGGQPVRLSLMQKMIVKPLVSTHDRLEKLGKQLTNNQLIQSASKSIRRGSEMVSHTTHQLADRFNSFKDDSGTNDRSFRSGRMGSSGGGGSGASEAQMKALQGMIIQLAHQNIKIQQTLAVLQTQLADLRDQRGDDPAEPPPSVPE